MNILNENQFENYINNMVYQTILAYNLRFNDKSLVEFRKYLKDYYLNVIKEHDGFFVEDPNSIRIALIGSGITSYDDEISDLYKKDYNKINCSSLKAYAKNAVKDLEKEVWGYNYPDAIIDFVDSHECIDTDSICNLIKYGLALHDRKNGYIEESSDKIKQANMLWYSLYKKYISTIDMMEEEQRDKSITYQVLKIVFKDDNHYSLASKRALIGIAYLEDSLDKNNDVNKEILDSTVRNINASKLEDNDIVKLIGKEFLIKLDNDFNNTDNKSLRLSK